MLRKLLLPILFLYSSIVLSQNNFDELYQKATVATFYSSTLLNPYYELKLAIKYADSARNSLSKNDENYNEKLFKVNSLINELNTSNDIAVDNLNYRIPSYSIITNNRNDINLIDDTEELLLEYLTEKHFEQADPVYKGTLNQNSHYFLINVNPFSDSLLGVLLDFFSLNSDHYAIRPHEISAILGKEGYLRYENDELNKDDFDKILKNYSIDKLYNLSYEDKGSILSGLFYWGGTLNIISSNNLEKEFKKYFEYFRVDKSNAFISSFLYLISLLISIFLVLRIFDVTSFKSVGYKQFIQKEFLKNDLILIISGLGSIVICYYIGSLFSPAANSYYNELISIAWVSYQTLGFSLISIVLLLLSTLKLSDLPSFSKENLSKVFFTSVGLPYAVLIVFNHFSGWQINDDYYEGPLMLALLIIPSWYSGKIMSKIIRKQINYQDVLSILIIATSIFISQYLFLSKSYFLSNISLGLISILVPLIYKLKIESPIVIQENGDQKNDENFVFDFISNGFNYEETFSLLKKYLNDDINKIFHLIGQQGVGRKTIIRKVCEENEYDYLYLDFSLISDDLNSFKQCFLQNKNLNLSDSFFETPVSFEKLYKGIGALSNILPLNIEPLILSDDENLNIKEIASELINQLNESKSNFCIVIEHLDQICPNDKIFFEEIVKKLTSKSFNSRIKIISLDHKENQNEILQKFKGSDLQFRVECKNINTALEEVFSSINLSNQLRHFILEKVDEFKNKSDFSIGKFSKFLNQLNEEDYIIYEENKFYLKNIPPSSLNLGDSYEYLIELYENLDISKKMILETASLIGFNFSLSLLSSTLERDSLILINELEELEIKNFISDLKYMPGKFQFNSIDFFEWLRNESLGINDEFKSQKIHEIYSRIIERIVNDNKYNIEEVNQIVKSIIEIKSRDFDSKKLGDLLLKNLFNITGIEHLKNDVSILLSKYIEITDLISADDQVSIIDVLNKYLSTFGKLDVLEKKIINKKSIIDELIDDFTFKPVKDNLTHFLEIILTDLCEKIKNTKSIDSLEKRYEYINETITVHQINSNRIQYQQTRIDNELKKNDKFIDTLIQISNKALDEKDYQLCGEIYRHVSLLYRNQGDQKNMIDKIYRSILLLENQNSLDKIPNNIGPEDIKSKIKRLFKLRLDKKELTNLSFSINRFIDAFSIGGNFEEVIEFSDYSIELNQKISDRRGLILAYRHKGKAYYELNDFDKSIKVYIEYFNYISQFISNETIMEFDNKSDEYIYIDENDISFEFENELTPVLEGILHNSIKMDNYDIYNTIRKNLQKESQIISHKVLTNKLFWFDKKITLKDILPITNDELIKPSLLASNIFKSYYLLSYSDNEISEEETYDSIQYVNSIMGQIDGEDKYTEKSFKTEINGIIKMNSDQRKEEFSSLCNYLFDTQTPEIYTNFYNSLVKISFSDLKLYKEEVEYLEIAKSYFS